MKKQVYIKPVVHALEVRYMQMLCESVNDVSGNTNLNNGGGGNINARSRGYNGWNDEDLEEEE